MQRRRGRKSQRWWKARRMTGKREIPLGALIPLSAWKAITLPLLLHPLREQKKWLSIEPDGFHGALVAVTTARHVSAAWSPGQLPPIGRLTAPDPPRCAAWR